MCKFFLRPTTNETWRNTRAAWKFDEGLLADLIRSTKKLEAAVGKLDPPAGE
jgi:hypothetical protein